MLDDYIIRPDEIFDVPQEFINAIVPTAQVEASPGENFAVLTVTDKRGTTQTTLYKGVPTGGTPGQVLTKLTNDDYSTTWTDSFPPYPQDTSKSYTLALQYDTNTNAWVKYWTIMSANPASSKVGEGQVGYMVIE